jgi:hypothetical protein
VPDYIVYQAIPRSVQKRQYVRSTDKRIV